MAAAGLPIALLLGAVADLAAGLAGGRGPFAALAAAAAELRRIATEAPPLHPLRAGGAAAAMFGGGLAAAASVGAFPGSLALLYPAMLLASVGALICLFADPPARPAVWLVEPATAVALGAGFLRWGAGDLEAIRGAQVVLGSGFEVGPPLASTGLFLAAVALLGAAAVRGGALTGGGAWRALCRWALDGAAVLVVAALVAGMELRSGAPSLGIWLGATIGAAGLVGVLRVGVAALPERFARWTPGAVLVLAVMAAVLGAFA